MAFALIIVLVIVAVVLATRTNKHLKRLDARCESAWEALNDQLERRNALIPRIVEGVEAQSTDQSEAVSCLVRMQAAVATASTPESRMSSSAELTSVLNTIITSLEIPAELREELEDIDVKLTYARATYNECVHDYNTAITAFPGRLVARSRFRPRQSFDAVGDTARHRVLAS